MPSPREEDQRTLWDYNAVTIIDREYFTHVRGIAHNLITWIGCNYDVTIAGAIVDFDRDVAGQYLIEQCCTILNYKEKAVEKDLRGPRFCTVADVERQLDLLFAQGMSRFGNWSERKLEVKTHVSLAFGMSVDVRKKKLPLEFKGAPYSHSIRL